MKVALVDADDDWAVRFRNALPDGASLARVKDWSAKTSSRLSELQPDIICLETALDVYSHLHALCPTAKFIVVDTGQVSANTSYNDWLRVGAIGLIRKDDTDIAIATAIAVAASRIGIFISFGIMSRLIELVERKQACDASQAIFTTAELRVIHLLTTTLSHKEIASKLGINPGTVHAHTASIYRKLHAHSRKEAVQRLSAQVFFK